jgi:nitrate reductase delta subunit
MRVLKLIAVLLDYPEEPLWAHQGELRAAVADPALSATQRRSLNVFLDRLLAKEPLSAQEDWLELFDRGRAMSLLLFEHIHGESRDRGQAMVDLITTYEKAGFFFSAKQLPDYLPVILEYLSARPAAEVSDWLHHVGHILELLAARAEQRESDYAELLKVLVEFARGKVDLGALIRRIATEARDDTPEAMDRVWEEEAVRFGPEAPAEDCKPTQRLPVGVKPTYATQVTP